MTSMLLLSVTDSLSLGNTTFSMANFNIWKIIAMVELAIIVYLLLNIGLKSRTLRDKKSAMKKQILDEGDIDFDNIMNSAFNAEQLYNVLIRKCHPDRFAPDDAKMQLANDISSRLTQCKHDISALNAIKNEAIEKLNINF